MSELYIKDFSLITCLGKTKQENLQGILDKDMRGMKRRDDLVYGKSLRFGTVDYSGLDEVPAEFLNIECNRLMLHCLQELKTQIDELIRKYGTNRIAVIVGSSNTGIQEGQMAIEYYVKHGEYPDWFKYDILELGSPAKFVAEYTGITGPAYAISTACSSSAKAFASAQNLIETGVVDAAIVGGVDSLCGYAANGFSSLEAVAADYSNSFSKNRDGITIGEAGALFIVSSGKGEFKIAGVGETSDAYHMTSPMPDGATASLAMKLAMKEAGVEADDIGYVCLHGTGTELNDSMESLAVYGLFGDKTFCSSMKPVIGHTLGACGAVELALCCLLMKKNRVPPHPWDGVVDPEIGQIKFADKEAKVDNLKYVISNSFAFGGSNASIVIEKCE